MEESIYIKNKEEETRLRKLNRENKMEQTRKRK